jgi:hypothetical protein
MEPTSNDVLHETYRLAKENNKMLHSMRRNAFWGGVFKILLWTGLIVAPIWLYSIYLAPVVQSLQQTMSQVQDTGAKAQIQLNSFQDVFQKLGEKVKSAFP